MSRMSELQLREEKSELQRELLVLEAQFGRPQAGPERQAVRAIYHRYRELKRRLSELDNRYNIFTLFIDYYIFQPLPFSEPLMFFFILGHQLTRRLRYEKLNSNCHVLSASAAKWHLKFGLGKEVSESKTLEIRLTKKNLIIPIIYDTDTSKEDTNSCKKCSRKGRLAVSLFERKFLWFTLSIQIN